MCKIACDDCAFDAAKIIPADMHEFHITVAPANPDVFKHNCEALGLKPIVLDLGVGTDMMATGRFEGNKEDAFKYASNYVIRILLLGYTIIRLKIEASPTNTEVNPIYYETHIAVHIDEINCVERLKEGFRHAGFLHISRNMFKSDVQMITIRSICNFQTREYHDEKVKSTLETLDYLGYKVKKVINELAWLDTNVNHDTAWLAEGLKKWALLSYQS